jgi:hypothetical protein
MKATVHGSERPGTTQRTATVLRAVATRVAVAVSDSTSVCRALRPYLLPNDLIRRAI